MEINDAIMIIGSRLGYQETGIFPIKEYTLQPNDCLFLYTDGLIENTGENTSDMLSISKIRKHFTNFYTDETSASAVINNILEQGKKIWQNMPPNDDLTCVAIKWIPLAESQFKVG